MNQATSWLFAVPLRVLVQPLDGSLSIHHLLFVLQHSASLDTSAEYLLRLSLHLFPTLVFAPRGIIMLQVNKYVLATSLQKWAKQVFFCHCSTYTVNTSRACLLSSNWNTKSEPTFLWKEMASRYLCRALLGKQISPLLFLCGRHQWLNKMT